jgi:hypothetical protein
MPPHIQLTAKPEICKPFRYKNMTYPTCQGEPVPIDKERCWDGTIGRGEFHHRRYEWPTSLTSKN